MQMAATLGSLLAVQQHVTRYKLQTCPINPRTSTRDLELYSIDKKHQSLLEILSTLFSTGARKYPENLVLLVRTDGLALEDVLPSVNVQAHGDVLQI